MAHYNKSILTCLAKSPCASSLLVFGMYIALRRFQRFEFDSLTVPADRFQGLIENKMPDRTVTELRIASACVKLSCIPEDGSEASVSLASIGTSEIRMFRGPEADCDRMPLFWLELFDHSTKTSIDSFTCHEIKEAVAIVDDFISQAGRLNEPGPGIAET